MKTHDASIGFVFALAGPAAVGAASALAHDAAVVAERALYVPAVVLAVTALMLPALYVAGAYVGVAPPARVFAIVGARALVDLGIVLCGIAPAVGFLVLTSEQRWAGSVMAAGALALAMLVALRTLAAGLVAATEQRSGRLAWLMAGWAIVGGGIGAHLFTRLVGA